MITNCATYTGDLQIKFDKESDWDLEYINGQPCMTDGFDTAVILSVFGESDFWQNDITNDPNEQYNSTFPDVIKQANVSQKTLLDGISAIKKALQWMIDTKACENGLVTGEIINVYAIGWNVDIIKGGVVSKYEINWNKGVVNVL